MYRVTTSVRNTLVTCMLFGAAVWSPSRAVPFGQGAGPGVGDTGTYTACAVNSFHSATPRHSLSCRSPLLAVWALSTAAAAAVLPRARQPTVRPISSSGRSSRIGAEREGRRCSVRALSEEVHAEAILRNCTPQRTVLRGDQGRATPFSAEQLRTVACTSGCARRPGRQQLGSRRGASKGARARAALHLPLHGAGLDAQRQYCSASFARGAGMHTCVPVLAAACPTDDFGRR